MNGAKLLELKSNIVYKKIGTRVKVRQELNTGKIDPNSINLIEFIDYNPSYDPEYTKGLIEKAKGSWEDVENVDEWLAELRGY